MQELQCADWAEYRNRIAAYAAFPLAERRAYIFRGQRDAAWRLESTLDRQFASSAVPEREVALQEMLAEFAEESQALPERDRMTVVDRLEFLARHHGLPTSVLDWTASPFVAAYFAFESPRPPTSGNVAVYAYDTRYLPATTLSDAALVRDLGSLLNNQRAVEQRGVFLRLPVGHSGEGVLGDGLFKYLIPFDQRRQALCELDEMTVTRNSLFRDRDAAAATVLLRRQLG